MRWNRGCALALVAVGLWGCGGSEPPPSTPPEPDPVELVQYPNSFQPERLHVDEESVYYLGLFDATEPRNSRGAIYRISAREPQESPTLLAETDASDFVLGSSHVYFIDSGELVETPQGPRRPGVLKRVPKAGGAQERIAEGFELFAPDQSAMVLTGPYLYWLNKDPLQPSGALYRTTADSPGPIEQVATAPSASNINLMANATHLYWLSVRYEPRATQRTWNGLFRVSLSSPTASPEQVLTWPHDVRLNLSSGSRNAAALTSAGIFVGLGDHENKNLALLPLEPGGTSPTLLEPLPEDITDMQAHEGTVYFSTRLGRGFRSRALNGSESTLLLTSHHPHMLAVSGAGLFFSARPGIWRKKL